jgi:hypothetical protein
MVHHPDNFRVGQPSLLFGSLKATDPSTNQGPGRIIDESPWASKREPGLNGLMALPFSRLVSGA